MTVVAQERANPYVGAVPFVRGQTLYGRDREVLDLLDLFIAERIVLLYSPSGAGKTSLIQAGLVPRLIGEGFQVRPIIRVGVQTESVVPSNQRQNRYIASSILSLDGGLPDLNGHHLDPSPSPALADYLHLGEKTTADSEVLIFDQFEEILTTDSIELDQKVEFFRQVGEVLRDRRYWALFAMREEYVAALDPYLRWIPTRCRTRYRLDLLGVEAAHKAIQGPAQDAGVAFSDRAAGDLVDNLRRVRVQGPGGTTEERPGPFVEPVQLQVVCRRLWDRLPSSATSISAEDVEGLGNVDAALADFYAESVAQTAAATGASERQIRDWFDRQLITEGGIRGQVIQGATESGGLDNRAVFALVDVHLVRAENRRDVNWYELAHDRLIEPVRTNNAIWRQNNLSELQRRAALWEEQRRPDGLLLRDRALEEAEEWAQERSGELTQTDKDFLAESQIARRRARRQRIFFIGTVSTAVLLFLALIGVLVAIRLEQQQADRAGRLSVRAAMLALSARATQQQDDQGALLAREAYNLNTRYNSVSWDSIDDALRATLNTSTFPRVLLEGTPMGVSSVAFSSDDRLVVAGAGDGSIHIWNIRQHRARQISFDSAGGGVNAISFMPGSRILAAGGVNGKVRLWNVQNHDRQLPSPPRLAGSIAAITYSASGHYFVIAHVNGTVETWDLRKSVSHLLHLGRSAVIIRSFALSPDGHTVAWSGQDGTAHLGNLKGHVSRSVNACVSTVYSLAFSPDGRTLAVGCSDNTLHRWSIRPLRPLAKQLALSNGLDVVTFHGRKIVVGTAGGTVEMPGPDQQSAVSLEKYPNEGPIRALAYSPDGSMLVTATDSGVVRLFGLGSSPAAISPLIPSASSSVSTVATSTDGSFIGVGWGNGRVELLSKQAEQYSLYDSVTLRGIVTAMAFSPDRTKVAVTGSTSGGRGKLWLWDTQTFPSSPQTWLQPTKSINAVAFSPHGHLLATGDANSTVSLWDVSRYPARQITQLHLVGGVIHSLAFSPDGHTLVAGGSDGKLWVVAVRGKHLDAKFLREHVHSVPTHMGSINAVTFSPDGKFLASASSKPESGQDSTVRTWTTADLVAGNSQPTYTDRQGYSLRSSSIAFSPDGSVLASAGSDATLELWDVKPRHSPEAKLVVLNTPNPANTLDAAKVVTFTPGDGRMVVGTVSGAVLLRPATQSLADNVCGAVWRNLSSSVWQSFLGSDIPYESTCDNILAGSPNNGSTASALAPSHPQSARRPASSGPSGIKNVFLIVMENHNWSSITGNPSAPYINRVLLPMASRAGQYYSPHHLHPSLPNYLWLEAGTNFGIRNSVSPSAALQHTNQHLVTLLNKAGVSWRAYVEDINGSTCPGESSYPYEVMHNPMVYFDDVVHGNNRSSSYCISHERPFGELSVDLRDNLVAQFNSIQPDLCDDMSNACAPFLNQVKQGDTWLSQVVPKILNSSSYQNGGAIFITWDESAPGNKSPLGLLLLSNAAKGKGFSDNIRYTHSSTLRTIEEIFHVKPLLRDAARARDLRHLFTSFP